MASKELIIGRHGMSVLIAKFPKGNDRLGSSIIKRDFVFWVFTFHDLVE